MQIEAAIKRSKFASVASDREVLELTLDAGFSRVNFDAENVTNRFNVEPGMHHFSETVQTSAPDAVARIHQALILAKREDSRGFSINFVIGDKKYGCSEDVATLEQGVRYFYEELGTAHSIASVKIGAEGLGKGSNALDLSEKFGASAYLLKGAGANRLLVQTKARNIDAAMYTLVRFGQSKENALQDLIRVVGQSYFDRRGVSREKIREKASSYAVYGTVLDVRDEVAKWQERGLKTMVLNIVLSDRADYLNQLAAAKSLSDMLRNQQT